ncbi:MAG: NPCBM/NEW2 domain-containing protein [Planctomycetota bacterium]
MRNTRSLWARVVFGTVLCATSLLATNLLAQDSAIEFWNAYDPRSEPLDVEVIQEWEDDLGHYSLVRYRLGKLQGTNKSAAPKIAAYYGYPKSASSDKPVPGIVQIHGGGQRANKGRVADWVKLGYAAISVNWGGKVLEESETPNTEWDGLAAGFERPEASGVDDLIHHNEVRGGPNTLFKEPHLLNSSWNLIAMSARRALTFMEERPEVDSNRLGVEGHSMGGRSTVLTAIDPRIKAAAPSVGGSGFLYQDMWGLPGSARRMPKESGLELYESTVSAQAYWPHIKAPVLFLLATNDFNAPTELVVRGMSLLPEKTERIVAMAPHLNHRFTTETAAARFLWMEAHLQRKFSFPKQSVSRIVLHKQRKMPYFQVVVDESSELPVEKVEVFYGYARDPRVRFWRSATVRKDGNVYTAPCPLFDTAEPLFAFANITYRLPYEIPARPGAEATDRMTISSQYQSVYPEALKSAGMVATERQERVIDDFQNGWQDWYQLNANNPQHWFYATRKIIDPSWMGPKGGKLAVELVTTEADNQIAVGIEVNTWQGYTGRKKDSFQAIVGLPKAGTNLVALSAADFKNRDGQSMADWDEATELTFTPAHRVSESTTEIWKGAPAELKNLHWQGGKFAKRPYPHEVRDGRGGESVAFEDEFQAAIRASVRQEQMDKEPVELDKNGRLYLTKELASKAESFVRIKNNLAWSEEPLTIGGKVYQRGLGVHADSTLVYALNRSFKQFHVIPAPDDGHRGQLEMKIFVDNRQVFTTGATRSSDKVLRKPVVISVARAKTLTLVVESLGDRGGDHANWAEAFLTKK